MGPVKDVLVDRIEVLLVAVSIERSIGMVVRVLLATGIDDPESEASVLLILLLLLDKTAELKVVVSDAKPPDSDEKEVSTDVPKRLVDPEVAVKEYVRARYVDDVAVEA